jgi:5'-nucleotidase/UDP-sugar diphosphatase
VDLLRRWLRLMAAAVLLCCVLLPVARAAEGETGSATILFTHDLHSSFLPRRDGSGGTTGGYARLASVLKKERAAHPEALTVDGGDFSVGSLIQSLYTTKAAELRTMGVMGYDAVTAGNHEFDYTGLGFGEMLTAARRSGEKTPALLLANYRPAEDNLHRLDLQRAMAAYGVEESMLLERGGVTYGVFGLMGQDAHSCAPTSGFVLEDPVKAARRCVDRLEEQGAQVIICLSHGGTNVDGPSEDEELARAVDGIDLIVSGHSHTTLEEPILAGETYIVSAGEYGKNLGSVTLSWDETGNKTVTDYRLIPIDGTVQNDQEVSALIEGWKGQVSSRYLAPYGMTYDQKLTKLNFDLPTPEPGVQMGSALGELTADSYLWAAEQMAGFDTKTPTVAVTADGVLRAPLYPGEITASMAFDVLSMGVGEDGSAGFPLVSCYLTGKELRAVAEVDASVTPLMPAAQLYMAGVQYSFNTHRMLFNRVTGMKIDDRQETHAGGTVTVSEEWGDLENDRLYRVVTGMYSAQMLDTVKERSFGILSIVPKDEHGEPITDFSQHILRDRNGNEIKEWYALASYLRSFGEKGVPNVYALSSGDGRKQVSHSWSPGQLLGHLNWIGFAALALLVLAAAAVVLLVRWAIRSRGRGRRGGGYRRRRLF